MAITKKGYPAAWEAGGGMTNTGDADIICGRKGEALNPVYIRGRGDLCCNNHALFIVSVGFHKISADHHRGDFNISIHSVVSAPMHEEPTWELLFSFSRGEWDKEPPAFLDAAISAATEKATCYHCREPHYIKNEE